MLQRSCGEGIPIASGPCLSPILMKEASDVHDTAGRPFGPCLLSFQVMRVDSRSGLEFMIRLSDGLCRPSPVAHIRSIIPSFVMERSRHNIERNLCRMIARSGGGGLS